MKNGDVRLVVGLSVTAIICLCWCFTALGEIDGSKSLWSQRLGLEDVFSETEAVSWETRVGGRKLNSLANCTPRAINQFPQGLFTQKQRAGGAVILHILVATYMFAAFAYICEDYFVPSLEILCDAFHIQPDVAGATLMAAGSSAPELATAVIAVFIAQDDIGLGAVVGSAVYNVMFVISVCALGAGMVVKLHWWPLVRDCTFYGLSVGALAFSILDEKVYWYEALGLVLLYVGYIVLMYFNTKLEEWIVPKFKHCCKPYTKSIKYEPETVVLYEKLKTSEVDNGTISKMENGRDNWDEQIDNKSDEDEASDLDIMYKEIGPKSNEEPESVFKMPAGVGRRSLFVVSLPIKVLLYLTVPDCRRPRWRKYVILTFSLSLVWLSVFSYIMVWMITVIGYTLYIPETIMALTFVAFGVSLPDVISSYIVVREGLGDMAVSNAVGSNVFDILICLGIPWLMKCGVGGFSKPVQVYSEGLLYSTLTLLLTVVFLLVATHINGWKLTKRYGIVLMIVYIIFNVLASLYELNVFGYVHPKECPRKD
uniref:Probable sodium/potassium/calcium exchanger CG1090 n=1 Tax=Crassostrea virginica TaxID=6565 RepID=A0A8B8E732_CRAVI|nr:probable sodium/potassium/calcium exchanger CG1090 [Crassostrea virginica]